MPGGWATFGCLGQDVGERAALGGRHRRAEGKRRLAVGIDEDRLDASEQTLVVLDGVHRALVAERGIEDQVLLRPRHVPVEVPVRDRDVSLLPEAVIFTTSSPLVRLAHRRESNRTPSS